MPQMHENTAPAFEHHPAATLPVLNTPGASLRMIVGAACGLTSPVTTFSPMFYAALELKAGARFVLRPEYAQCAVYAVDSAITVAGAPLGAQQMAVSGGSEEITIEAGADARVMLLGGEALDGERFIWWNFVASSRTMIEAAKRRWRERRFPAVPGETEWIPLPQERKPPESFS
jgi:redox-sensitive bicupin YhaK (pirin superfamily)